MTDSAPDSASSADAPDWSRVKAAFQAVLAAAPDGRQQALADACGDDDALRREVATLVAAHGRADGFLETPAAVEASSIGRRSAMPSSPTWCSGCRRDSRWHR